MTANILCVSRLVLSLGSDTVRQCVGVDFINTSSAFLTSLLNASLCCLTSPFVTSKGCESLLVSRQCYTTLPFAMFVCSTGGSEQLLDQNSFMVNVSDFIVFLFLSAALCALTQVQFIKECARTSPGHKVTVSSNLPTAVKTSLFTSQSEWI